MEKLKSKASFLYLVISMWRMKQWRKKCKNPETDYDHNVDEIGNKTKRLYRVKEWPHLPKANEIM